MEEVKLKKFCDVGKHQVQSLWRSRIKDKNNPDKNIQDGCCKNCLSKAPKKVVKEKIEVKKGLNVFFAEQALKFPVHCENCNARLHGNTMFDRRKQTCHILPKRNDFGFPSVAVHPQNRVFMCCQTGCYGHERWDNGDAADRIKMAVYPVAVERFKSFEHLLTPKELIKAYKYLNLE